MGSIKEIAAVTAATLLVFTVLDVTWLALVAVRLFERSIGPILRPSPQIAPAAAFYLIYAVGIVILAVRPALERGSSWVAAQLGAVLGLTAYATFDLTCLAIIQGWTTSLAAMDMLWGTVGTTVAALAGYATGARRSPGTLRDRGQV